MILLPVAIDESREPLAVADATSSGQYSCPGCDRGVFPKKGPVRQYHFSHYPDMQCTNPESVIHRAAKFMIAMGVEDARSNGSSYFATAICDWCETAEVTIDLPPIADLIAVEEPTVADYIPDVSLIKTDEISLAIEVMYTHPVPPEKEQAYRAQVIPEVEVVVTQDSLSGLRDGFTAAKSIIVMCDGCKGRIEQHIGDRRVEDFEREVLVKALSELSACPENRST